MKDRSASSGSGRDVDRGDHFLDGTLRPAVIAMIHVGALPGTPQARFSVDELAERACREALCYQSQGVDALMLENMHDRPYLRETVGPEIVATMTRVAWEVRRTTFLPCGVQVLAGANQAALAVALAAGLDFIRVEGFVFGHVADEGWIDGCAGPLLRSRRAWDAQGIALWTDVKKKHSAHALTADVSVSETARAAAFNGSDAVILTGSHTGEPADVAELEALRDGLTGLPILIGSGIDPQNAARYAAADGFIVGSSLKERGDWRASPDPARVEALMNAVRALPPRSLPSES